MRSANNRGPFLTSVLLIGTHFTPGRGLFVQVFDLCAGVLNRSRPE
jgi:hypothetical protein